VGCGLWFVDCLSIHTLNDHPIIIFDGVCNLCNASVNFVIKKDRKNIFRFTTLQSSAGQKLLEQFQFSPLKTDSFVLIDRGKAYEKSSAALRVLHHLPWHWKILSIFRIIPKFLRNFIYDFIAKNRYAWFGRKEECMIPSPSLKAKFLE